MGRAFYMCVMLLIIYYFNCQLTIKMYTVKGLIIKKLVNIIN